jgi:hypothetical protein
LAYSAAKINLIADQALSVKNFIQLDSFFGVGKAIYRRTYSLGYFWNIILI